MSTNATLKQSTNNANILQAKSFRPVLKKHANGNQPKRFISNNNITRNKENDLNSQNVSMVVKDEKNLYLKENLDDSECNIRGKSFDQKSIAIETQKLSNLSINSKPLNTESSKEKAAEKESAKISLNLDNLITNLNLKNKFSKEEYRLIENKYLRDEYSDSILATLFADEVVNTEFLSKHKITERMRSRMVDWMIEVLTNYNCTEETFFIAVSIMDKFCLMNTKCLLPGELHLIGVASMFLASKYQDIYPLRLKVIYDKIAHRKLTCEEIKSKENEISKCLNYVFTLPNLWDFITVFIEEIFIGKYNHFMINNKTLSDSYYPNKSNDKRDIIIEKLYSKNMITLLKLVCIYLAKMNCHDYSLMNQKPSLLAASSIYVGVKICEQINKEDYITDYFTNKLSEVSTYTENEIIKCSQKILSNAQNFESLFPNLENLKRVHFKPIIEFKQKK